MTAVKIRCAYCGKRTEKAPNEFNRAQRAGLKLYCNRRCAGLGRRKHQTKSELVERKRIYDAEYRKKNLEWIKAKKHAHFKKTYDPEKARIERKKTMARHVEYCRRPEYKHWKSKYDRTRRDAEYGPFAEAARLCIDLNRAIKERMTDEQIRHANDTWNKTQRRRRATKEEPERSRPRNRYRRHDHSSAHG